MAGKVSRMAIDISMVILLPLLMAYALIGETFHEAAGFVMFLLFIVHNVMNRKWYTSLAKGKYTVRRSFQIALDLLLLVFMFVQPVSGILMSKHLFTFLNIPGVSAAAREIHLAAAFWGFVLLSLHAGTHLSAPLGKLKKKDEKKHALLLGSLGIISAYGAYAFVKRGFPGYMLMSTKFVFFDFSEPRMFFFADYVSVMVLFAFAGSMLAGRLSAGKRG